jgi:prepilin-type N-terminal cleavage/methylation domain-containing protein
MTLRAQRNTGGFTIIEVMVALFLLSFVVAAVYSSWMAIVRGAKVGLHAAAEVQRSRIAVRTLEEAVSAARSFPNAPEYYTFDAENGSKAFMSFVAALPESFPRSGRFESDVRRVTFALEAGSESGTDLVLRQRDVLMEEQEDEQVHPIVLARGVRKFEMQFWDLREGEWIDEWTKTNELPALVWITLQIGDDSLRAKPGSEINRVIPVPGRTDPQSWQGLAGFTANSGRNQPIRPGQLQNQPPP